MPLYMDKHELEVQLSPAEVAQAHLLDVSVAGKYGVKLLTYWFHAGAMTGFCLAEAPNPNAIISVHRDSTGHLPSQVIEVERSQIERFLGPVQEPPLGVVWEAIAFRTMIYTEIDTGDESERTQEERPNPFLVPGRAREVFAARGGEDVSDSRSGMLGCFPSTTAAVESALSIQSSFGPLELVYRRAPAQVRIGLSLGAPVSEDSSLFEATIEEAVRLCRLAKPGEILATEAVRVGCAQQEFAFTPRPIPAVADHSDSICWTLSRSKTPLTRWEASREKSLVEELSPREYEVLSLLALGKTNQEIAELLSISLTTAVTHIRHIFSKTGVANRTEAAAFALRHHLV
jgi:DNA-binding CsgD family transcriptional regulator